MSLQLQPLKLAEDVEVIHQLKLLTMMNKTRIKKSLRTDEIAVVLSQTSHQTRKARRKRKIVMQKEVPVGRRPQPKFLRTKQWRMEMMILPHALRKKGLMKQKGFQPFKTKHWERIVGNLTMPKKRPKSLSIYM
jgi:hypothetical protein